MSDQSVDATWFGRVGIELDILLNVLLFDGKNGQTVSEHSAEAEAAGKEWGCIVCSVLSALVQRNHCLLVLTAAPTPTGSAARALVLILLVFAVMGFGGRFVLSFLF